MTNAMNRRQREGGTDEKRIKNEFKLKKWIKEPKINEKKIIQIYFYLYTKVLKDT